MNLELLPEKAATGAVCGVLSTKQAAGKETSVLTS